MMLRRTFSLVAGVSLLVISCGAETGDTGSASSGSGGGGASGGSGGSASGGTGGTSTGGTGGAATGGGGGSSASGGSGGSPASRDAGAASDARPAGDAGTAPADARIAVDAPIGAAPCLTGTTPCRSLFPIAGTTAKAVVYRSFPLDVPNGGITLAIIVIHGGGENAPGYFERMITSVKSQMLEKSTVVVAPFFNSAGASAPDELAWPSGAWREGADGNTKGGQKVSSYRVLDAVIEAFGNPDVFPNMKRIIVTGHSAGGQVTQRYAAAGKAEVPHAPIRYLIANPSSYMYMNDMRLVGGMWTNTGAKFSACPTWDDYKYGLKKRDSVPYVGPQTDAEIVKKYTTRDVVYLLGTGDTLQDSGLDMNCEGYMEGYMRYERGKNYFEFMNKYFPGHPHRKVEVPGIGHDGDAMFNSMPGRSVLFN